MSNLLAIIKGVLTLTALMQNNQLLQDFLLLPDVALFTTLSSPLSPHSKIGAGRSCH